MIDKLAVWTTQFVFLRFVVGGGGGGEMTNLYKMLIIFLMISDVLDERA